MRNCLDINREPCFLEFKKSIDKLTQMYIFRQSPFEDETTKFKEITIVGELKFVNVSIQMLIILYHTK